MAHGEECASGFSAEALIDMSPTGVAMIDTGFKFLRHSPLWNQRLGLSEESLVGRTMAEVFPGSVDRLRPMLDEAMSGRRVQTGAVWVTLRTGQRSCLRFEASPWRKADGTVGGIAMFVLDLTAASEALERSRRAERRLKVATEIAQLHVFEVDYRNRTLTTDGAEDTFFDRSITFEEFAADPFCGVADVDRERVMAEVMARAGVDAHATHHSEYRVRRLDDREIWTSSAVEFETDSQGELSNAIFALQNVTDRKLAERALLEAKDEAEAANRAKSDFLAKMSHEIRTPLNGVLGMAQAMAADPLPPEQAQRLALIRQSGESLLAILNDILDLSKIEAGKLTLEETTFDLTDLLVGVQGAFAARAGEQGLEFRLHVAPEAAGLYRGDPTRVKQIAYNLLSNAVKFTERGCISVDVARGPAGLELRVTDTGLGMSQATLDRLFEKFEQADASTTRRYGGTGLGLAISRELAALMGGDIAVESREGHGSTFTATLPLTWMGEAPAQAPSTARQPDGLDSVGGVRVLVAEDNPTNQQVISTLLRQVGVEPVVVGNGAEAVAAWSREPWDLILMDAQMPVLDGLEATQQIRAIERAEGRPRTPIIALTANAMSHQLAAYREAGMDDVVAKPIEVGRLYGALEAALAADPEPGELARAADA